MRPLAIGTEFMERLRGVLSIAIFVVLIGFIGLSGFRLITGLAERAHLFN